MRNRAPSSAQRRLTQAAMRLFVERGATQLSVVDLAQAAGVARGTVYNNLDDLSGLFDLVAAELAAEMRAALAIALAPIADAAERLAAGVRLAVRRSVDEPEWGRFVARFGFSAQALRLLWAGRPLEDLADGRYRYRAEHGQVVANLVSGAAFAAIVTALETTEAAEAAGSDAAEWTLVALGLPRDEARALARRPLPARLPSLVPSATPSRPSRGAR